jgi:glutamine amidotransferase-like uncharacterized protein
MTLLRRFVSEGGSYLGLCAGAWLADSTLDDANKVAGLGFLPGETYDFLKTPESVVLKINWGGKVLPMYFQAGPAFRISPKAASKVKILASYTNGTPAAIQFAYGKGSVILSGPHPEATPYWYREAHLKVPPILSRKEALDLIRLALLR